MNEIQELLSFDPLGEAEKITGESYKTSEDTVTLGVLMQMQKSREVAEEMGLRDDTFYGSKFDDALRILDETGFKVIHQHEVNSPDWAEEKFKDQHVILWRDGVLAVISSYNATSVNSFSLYYNWHANPDIERIMSFVESGSMNREAYDERGEKIWIGHHDVRTGFRHVMNRLESNGKFLSSWIEPQFLWFLDYSQEKDDKNYKEINAEVIATFPAEVSQAILR